MEMLTFVYKGKRRVAVELEVDDRGIGCLHCFQVQPQAGYRSFKVHLMQNIERIQANPAQFPELVKVLAERADNAPAPA